jgi:hypothetical protein
VAEAAAITAVAIPAHTPTGLDLQALCKSMNLAGVLDPFVGWTENDDTISAQGQVLVLDCHGTVFFQSQASDAGATDPNLAKDAQVDARMATTAKRLAERFVEFNKAHAAAWDNLRLAVAPPTPSKEALLMGRMSALANCSSYGVAKRYVQAIAACNDADVTETMIPYVTKTMHSKPQTTLTRSAVGTFGLIIVGAYLWKADAHYQLGEPAAGIAAATTCASWINTLSAYFKRLPASEMNQQLRTSNDELSALRLRLATEYPSVISP